MNREADIGRHVVALVLVRCEDVEALLSVFMWYELHRKLEVMQVPAWAHELVGWFFQELILR